MFDDRHGQKLFKRQQTCAQAVINVVIVIGDIIGKRGDLRLQRRPAVQVEIKLGIGRGKRPFGCRDRAIVLGEALKRLPGQVEPVPRGIRPVELGSAQPFGDGSDGAVEADPF